MKRYVMHYAKSLQNTFYVCEIVEIVTGRLKSLWHCGGLLDKAKHNVKHNVMTLSCH
jgi:hypothetical protein